MASDWERDCRIPESIDGTVKPLDRIYEAGRNALTEQALKTIAEYEAIGSACEAEPVPEAVNHPPHYNRHPSGVEAIVVIEHMTFNAGSAVKYLWRAGLKDEGQGTDLARIKDLKKAAWYCAREIERLEKESK